MDGTINGPFLITKMFQNQQYADDFRSGKLFANPLSYFQDLETQGGQADPYEGSTWSGENDILTLSSKSMDSTTITPDDLEEPMRIQQINHVNVVCFYAWRLPLVKSNELPPDLEEQVVNIQVPGRLRREFGDHIIIVTDRNEFFRRLKKELNRQYINGDITSFKGGLVQYADYQPLHWDIRGPDATQNKFLNPAFYKRTFYQYQSEYRVAFERRFVYRNGRSCILNIGDIRDITIESKTSSVFKLRVIPKS